MLVAKADEMKREISLSKPAIKRAMPIGTSLEPTSNAKRPKTSASTPSKKNGLGPKVKCYRCGDIHRTRAFCSAQICLKAMVSVLFTGCDYRKREYQYVAFGEVHEIRQYDPERAKQFDQIEEFIMDARSVDESLVHVHFKCKWFERKDGIFSFSKSLDDAELYPAHSILCAVPLQPLDSDHTQYILQPEHELSVYQRLVNLTIEAKCT